ncbi:MAG: 50S ribosomal protein L3 [Chloroflexi bacterium]|jgi:large subunit ribosomal protein L3|uniref:Large ribosomal subunit protein uL3 n=1 Tax=Candidatus Thermofonsia Clade 3 bacterium TaxID=2364212 RepID=A0A2M8QD84_9CHLR|nr:50S ribosomal protein L3 [Candidatus Roseilinea sp. NK_OTU-006]PJF47728.1 MAG: 50S ribosomal protein L3 [Candidatus Thermofonsia Clade 3 bacterium]RMG61797.1 MAG: 50S ribosomal protein L3 [Chloroflexota bacterium]
MKKLIGRKVGMTQLFDEKGNVTGVTVIEAGPNYVTQVKTVERDGYNAIQLGFGEVKARKLTRGELGHLGLLKPNDKHPNRRKLEGVPPLRYLTEARVKEVTYKEGDVIKADIFAVGEYVDVTGTMKGRGFSGGIKRHGFHRQKKTHGASDRERAPGSIGAGTTPGRVEKGQRMAGHYGNTRVTAMNARVMLVDAERNLIAVSGSVPGAKGGIVVIKEARKGGKK